jgi:hypothetical protein
MGGYNKAILNEKQNWQKLFSKNDRPCIFLSHKKEDKPDCRKIAEYIKDKDIDIFFDEQDAELQRAVIEENPFKITERIKAGIRESSHMLLIVSKKTLDSKWVPFETGYGNAAIIDKSFVLSKNNLNIKLSVLTLEDLSEVILPEFLQIAYPIRGKVSFDRYLEIVKKETNTTLITERKYTQSWQQFTSNQLNDVLNSNL